MLREARLRSSGFCAPLMFCSRCARSGAVSRMALTASIGCPPGTKVCLKRPILAGFL